MSSIQETKRNFINFLENRGEYFRKVHEGQYRIRCPFCGDTQKNLNEGHLYIKCDLDNDYNIAYNCFKCNEHSSHMTKELLNLLGCGEELKTEFTKNEKGMTKYKRPTTKILHFDYKRPDIHIYPEKLQYISNRLEIDFSDEDYENMKVITSLYDFLSKNNIKERPFNDYVMKLIQNKYVGFLTNGNSHILFRDITNTQKFSWIKYPITKESLYNRVFYTVNQKDGIDLLTRDDIVINMSEGVFDCLGVSYHMNNLKSNTMNIAVTSQQYASMINFLISIGLVGGNVSINIYTDNDEMFNDNKKKNYRTSFDYLKKALSSYNPLFKRITLYKNMKSKDFGIPKKEISIKKIII